MLRTSMVIAAFLLGSAAANAEPLKLEPNQMDSVTAGATNPADVIDNPAFDDSGRNSIENVNNPDLRFGKGGGVALPGNGSDNASENAPFDTYILRPVGRN